MDRSTLTPMQDSQRCAVRNFLMLATLAELRAERAISLERGETFRAACIAELIGDALAELAPCGPVS